MKPKADPGADGGDAISGCVKLERGFVVSFKWRCGEMEAKSLIHLLFHLKPHSR